MTPKGGAAHSSGPGVVTSVALWEFRRFFKLKDQWMSLALSLLVGAAFWGAKALLERNERDPVTVAAHDGDAVLLAALPHPGVQLVDVHHRPLGRKGEGDEGELGRAPHGGDIADVHGQGLPPQVLPGDERGREVDALHERVGSGQDDGVGSA